MKKGKIASCPAAIREEVCRRISDGYFGEEIMEWLSTEPEVVEVLKRHFGSRPINHSNLKEWKKAGYKEWLKKKERLAEMQALGEHMSAMGRAAGGGMVAGCVVMLGAKLTEALEGGKFDLKEVAILTRTLTTLRWSEQRERMIVLRERVLEAKTKDQSPKDGRVDEAVLTWAEVGRAAWRRDMEKNWGIDAKKARAERDEFEKKYGKHGERFGRPEAEAPTCAKATAQAASPGNEGKEKEGQGGVTGAVGRLGEGEVSSDQSSVAGERSAVSDQQSAANQMEQTMAGPAVPPYPQVAEGEELTVTLGGGFLVTGGEATMTVVKSPLELERERELEERDRRVKIKEELFRKECAQRDPFKEFRRGYVPPPPSLGTGRLWGV